MMYPFAIFCLSFHCSLALAPDTQAVKRLSEVFADVMRSDPTEFNVNLYPEEFWPHFAALRQLEPFRERTKIAHSNAAKAKSNDKDIGDIIFCQSCGAVVDVVIDAVNAGTPIEEIEDSVAAFCTLTGIVDKEVCDGIVLVFGPWVEFLVLEQLGDRATSELVCGVFLNRACLGEELEDEVNGWTVALPATPKPPFSPPPPPVEGSPTAKVLLFTDIHLDLSYLPGSPIECTLPLCCLASTGLATGEATPAPYWGTYGNCDTPVWMLEQMFRQIRTNFPGEFAYAIFTGDAPAHDVWVQTRESNLEHSKVIIDLFKTYFPDVDLYITLGNHEGLPVNVYPTDDVTNPDFRADWLYGGLAEEMAEFLSPEAAEQFSRSGSYAVRPLSGLKIVNLNNNYGVSQNVAVYNNFTDPGGVLAWLITELQDSEDSGETVHIITHHPSRSTLPGWEREFKKIISRYENTVNAIMVGHTHSDEQEIWVNEDNVPTVVTYINPSVTPNVGRQPEFRIFTFDGGYEGASWQVLDIDTYSTDIEAYTGPDTPPVFELLYSAREAYGMSGLQASDWFDVMNRAFVDDALYESLIRFHEQNYQWELPSNRTEYLCGKLYNANECIFDNFPSG